MSYKSEMMDIGTELTFRVGHPGDEQADAVVRRLAALDSAEPPQAPYVIAALGNRPVAARSLTTGETVADPFARTADILPLLAMRAAQLALPAAVSRARGRRLRALLRAT